MSQKSQNLHTQRRGRAVGRPTQSTCTSTAYYRKHPTTHLRVCPTGKVCDHIPGRRGKHCRPTRRRRSVVATPATVFQKERTAHYFTHKRKIRVPKPPSPKPQAPPSPPKRRFQQLEVSAITTKKFAQDTQPRYIMIHGKPQKAQLPHSCRTAAAGDTASGKSCQKVWDDYVIQGKELARGSFNTVCEASLLRDKIRASDVAKAPRLLLRISTESRSLTEIERDVRSVVSMGRKEIGPRVFDAWRKEIKRQSRSNQDASRRTSPPKTENHLIVLMERYDMNLKEFANSSHYLKNRTQAGNPRLDPTIRGLLVSILGRMANMQLFCLDLKPLNIVVQIKPFQIRFIDFDKDWCFRNGLEDHDSKAFCTKYQLSKQAFVKIMHDLSVILLAANINSPDHRHAVRNLSHVLSPWIVDNYQRLYHMRKPLSELIQHKTVQIIIKHYLDGADNFEKTMRIACSGDDRGAHLRWESPPPRRVEPAISATD